LSPPLSPVRTRNAAATRTAILEAARRRFAHEGYDRTGLRDIASDAGVDAALISRYFGGKEELFGEVLAFAPDVLDFLDGDREQFGARVAKMLIIETTSEKKLELLLIMLRSATSLKAAEAIRHHSNQAFFQPLEAWLGGENAAVRARLLSCVLMGATMNRMIHEDFLLDDAQRRDLCDALARTLNHYASGPICDEP